MCRSAVRVLLRLLRGPAAHRIIIPPARRRVPAHPPARARLRAPAHRRVHVRLPAHVPAPARPPAEPAAL